MFDWNGFLDLADRLLADAPDEASLRSATSRAYYAAYHAAAAFVRASGLLRQGHTHHRVWIALTTDANPARSAIGDRGDRLRRRRIAADYQDDALEDLVTSARDAVDEARSLVEAINRLA